MGLPYLINIPFATNNPSADQPNMQTNTNSINTLIAQDHVGFNNTFEGNPNSGGWHTSVHHVAQTSNPTNVTDVGIVYTKNVTPTGGTLDTQLFYESALGVITQLTGPNAALASTNGYVWIGPILLQWGRSSGGSIAPTGTITFPIAFPNANFVVCPTLISQSGGTSSINTISYITGTGTTTQFKWNYTGTSSYVGFYWIAIGN